MGDTSVLSSTSQMSAIMTAVGWAIGVIVVGMLGRFAWLVLFSRDEEGAQPGGGSGSSLSKGMSRSRSEKTLVGRCESCGRDLRAKGGGLKPGSRFTCRCGHINVFTQPRGTDAARSGPAQAIAASQGVRQTHASPRATSPPPSSPSANQAAGQRKSLSLAVLAYDEPPGRTTLKGEDDKGRRFNLHSVTQAALLFVPQETLHYLKQDSKLWDRVTNRDEIAHPPVKKGEPEAGGLLASLLVGPLIDSMQSANLGPGEFRVTVVDTYADATMKVQGLAIFNQ